MLDALPLVESSTGQATIAKKDPELYNETAASAWGTVAAIGGAMLGGTVGEFMGGPIGAYAGAQLGAAAGQGSVASYYGANPNP